MVSIVVMGYELYWELPKPIQKLLDEIPTSWEGGVRKEKEEGEVTYVFSFQSKQEGQGYKKRYDKHGNLIDESHYYFL